MITSSCTTFSAGTTASTTTKTGNRYPSRFRLLAMAAAAAFGLATASSASAACNGGPTLNGRYGMQVYGATRAGVGKFLVGTMTFDGACGAKGTVSIGENGTVNTFASVTGSYNANPDSTITLSLALPNATSPETYDIGFSPILGEAVGNETDSSAIATIDLKAQVFPASNPAIPFSNALLKGTWAASCIAPASGQSDLNYFTVDGSTANYGVFGNIAGTDHNYEDSFQILPFTGQYSVLPDGSFGGSLGLAGKYPFGFSGSIANNGNELQYVVIQGAGVLESCVAKRVK